MAQTKRKNGRLPQAIEEKILKRAGKSDEPLVLTIRGGKPNGVYGLEQYQQRVQSPEPRTSRTRSENNGACPDPLGAIDAYPPYPLTRESMYEE